MSRFEHTSEPVTRTQIVRFAGAAGDFNPMHHDEPFARAAGQPGVFAMGQLQAAMLAAAVARWLGGAAKVESYGVRFRDKVWPGDRLVLRGRLVEAPHGSRLELTAVREADETVVVTGWARARA
jgi:acyl dehydratase